MNNSTQVTSFQAECQITHTKVAEATEKPIFIFSHPATPFLSSSSRLIIGHTALYMIPVTGAIYVHSDVRWMTN